MNDSRPANKELTEEDLEKLAAEQATIDIEEYEGEIINEDWLNDK